MTEFLGVEFEAHPSYVVGFALTRERPVEPGYAVGLMLTGQLVDGTLERPLGGRVLDTEQGFPVAAVSALPPM